jgi:NAD(P)-dependent dehydrogenase (short-subunit alcohol dehydrogenase family)
MTQPTDPANEPTSGGQRPTILVTGATGGIGEAIATQLSERGARVLVGARTPKRGEAAVDRIRSRVRNPELEVVAGDLSLMREAPRVLDHRQHATARLLDPQRGGGAQRSGPHR